MFVNPRFQHHQTSPRLYTPLQSQSLFEDTVCPLWHHSCPSSRKPPAFYPNGSYSYVHSYQPHATLICALYCLHDEPQLISSLQTAIISIGNSIQAYSTLTFTSRVYNPTPIDPPPTVPKHVTALSSRTFGTWTFLAAVIRMYAAYNIENPAM
jgi:hypothetical protein